MTKPDELRERVAAAVEAYNAMSPVDKALHDADQKRSFVRGQLGSEPGPSTESILAAEVRRLRTALTPAGEVGAEDPVIKALEAYDAAVRAIRSDASSGHAFQDFQNALANLYHACASSGWSADGLNDERKAIEFALRRKIALLEARGVRGEPFNPRGGIELVDEPIRPLVQALWDAGIATVASCCGHGHRPGNIALKDGRELFILPDFVAARAADKFWPLAIDGMPVGEPTPPAPDDAGDWELVERLNHFAQCDLDAGFKDRHDVGRKAADRLTAQAREIDTLRMQRHDAQNADVARLEAEANLALARESLRLAERGLDFFVTHASKELSPSMAETNKASLTTIRDTLAKIGGGS